MKRRVQVSLIIASISTLAVGQVWLSHMRVDTAQQLTRLKQERDSIRQDVQNLKLELSSLMRPDTLRRLAREKLGMHAPAPMQVVKP